MVGVALKGLAGRKFRATLTALAIVLGVAMISGTYVLTDTIKAGFDTIFDQAYKNTDAVITGKVAFDRAGEDDAPAFPEEVLARVKELPGVGAVSGAVEDEAKLVDRDGDLISTGGIGGIALSVHPGGDQRFNPLELEAGEWPRGLSQIAIDKATADKQDLGVGDTIGVVARGPERRFDISGIVTFGGLESIGGATLAIFDLPTAQQLFDKRGRLDFVRVAGKPGVTEAELVRQIRPVLPATAQVRSATVQAEKESADSSDFVAIFQMALLAFGGIALFVGAFVIANTLSITIAQRVREFATLRTLGASRRQVLGSVILEALVIGLVAAVIGLFLGLLLARGLNSLFVAFGIDLPRGSTVFATRTIVVSIVVGVLITLLASLRPALRATRVPPIAAVREGSVLPPSRLARFGLVTALAVLAVGVALLCYGVFADGLSGSVRLLSLAAGCLLLFVGVALVAPRLVPPLASVLGWPAKQFGGSAGALARENSMRNPARTASTAAALMIGLALVTFVAVLAAGLRSSFTDAVDDLFVADYALTGQGAFEPVTPAAAEAISRLTSVEVVSAVREGSARAFGENVFITAVDRNMSKVLDVDWTQGSEAVPEELGGNGAFLEQDYAKDHGLSVGSPLRLETTSGKVLTLEVKGVFEEPKGGSPFGPVTISTRTYDENYPQPVNAMTFVNTEGGVSDENSERLEAALASFPDAKVVTADQFKQDSMKPLNDILNVLYVLLGLSVIVSVFGIINTLVLTVFERTRELGMLRAVGMTRRQVRRMIRHESIVTSLIGAALGIVVGVFLALLVTRALSDEGIVFAVPYGSVGVFVLAAIAVGLLAAILPARRASRLNVLRALQYE
jgi:putative ABC transport system permease protein